MIFKNKRISKLRGINKEINEYLNTDSIKDYKKEDVSIYFDKADRLIKKHKDSYGSFSSIKRWLSCAPSDNEHVKIALENLTDVIRDAIRYSGEKNEN